MFSDLNELVAVQATLIRDFVDPNDFPRTLALVEITNTATTPVCEMLVTGVTVRDSGGAALLEDDAARVLAPTEVAVPSGSFVQCLGPDVTGYVFWFPLQNVPFATATSIEVGLTGTRPFAYDSKSELAPESYAVSNLVLNLVVRNTGGTAADRTTGFFDGAVVLLDGADRPVFAAFLAQAPFAQLQPNQTMTITSEGSVRWDGTASRLRAFIPHQ